MPPEEIEDEKQQIDIDELSMRDEIKIEEEKQQSVIDELSIQEDNNQDVIDDEIVDE